MRLILLNRFLQFLELLETIAEFVSFLCTPIGLSACVCLLSYFLLLGSGCDVATSGILTSAIALTAYSIVKQPDA